MKKIVSSFIAIALLSCSSEIESPERILGQENCSSPVASSSSNQSDISYYCDYGPAHSEGGGGCTKISGLDDECNLEEAKITTSCATTGIFCNYGAYCATCTNKGGCWPIRSSTDSKNCALHGTFVDVCPSSSL